MNVTDIDHIAKSVSKYFMNQCTLKMCLNFESSVGLIKLLFVGIVDLFEIDKYSGTDMIQLMCGFPIPFLREKCVFISDLFLHIVKQLLDSPSS